MATSQTRDLFHEQSNEELLDDRDVDADISTSLNKASLTLKMVREDILHAGLPTWRRLWS